MTDSPLTPEKQAELERAGIPAHYHTHFQQLRLDGLVEKLGIHFEELGPEYSRATMPVEGNTQVVGLLHGGASAALAETLGSLSAYLAVADQGMIALGLDLNVTHLRPASSGRVTAVCRAIKLGSSICVHSVEIFDESNQQICIARITNKILQGSPR